MTLFVMTYCNKISLLQIPLSGHSFIHSFIHLLMPGFELSENIYERSASSSLFVLCLEVLKHLAF